jgi:hypothetical protein
MMDAHEHAAGEKRIVGYRPLSEFLTGAGYPISCSSLQKYCSPAIAIGPPIESYWGRLPMFEPSRALDWAKRRVRPARRREPVA